MATMNAPQKAEITPINETTETATATDTDQ